MDCYFQAGFPRLFFGQPVVHQEEVCQASRSVNKNINLEKFSLLVDKIFTFYNGVGCYRDKITYIKVFVTMLFTTAVNRLLSLL